MLVRIIDVPKEREVKVAWSTITVIIAIMITMVPEEIAIMIIMVIMVPEERGPEDAEGEEEAKCETEEERGEDRERDQHRVPGQCTHRSLQAQEGALDIIVSAQKRTWSK